MEQVTTKNLEFRKFYNSYCTNSYGQVICSKFIERNFGQCPEKINLYVVKNPRGAFRISNVGKVFGGVLWSEWDEKPVYYLFRPLSKKLEKLFTKDNQMINVDVYVEAEWS